MDSQFYKIGELLSYEMIPRLVQGSYELLGYEDFDSNLQTAGNYGVENWQNATIYNQYQGMLGLFFGEGIEKSMLPFTDNNEVYLITLFNVSGISCLVIPKNYVSLELANSFCSKISNEIKNSLQNVHETISRINELHNLKNVTLSLHMEYDKLIEETTGLEGMFNSKKWKLLNQEIIDNTKIGDYTKYHIEETNTEINEYKANEILKKRG